MQRFHRDIGVLAALQRCGWEYLQTQVYDCRIFLTRGADQKPRVAVKSGRFWLYRRYPCGQLARTSTARLQPRGPFRALDLFLFEQSSSHKG